MINVNKITKTYYIHDNNNKFFSMFSTKKSQINALQEISFNIEDGEMVGYIGPNGSGKSTTIKILSGILYPDSGYCKVNGMVPWKDRKKYVKNIGVVFGQRSQLWWDLPIKESFKLLKEIYNVPNNEYQKNLNLLVDMLDISKLLNSPTRQLSLGERMRCEIACALLHSPDILFLDEPTIGLDAVSKKAVRHFIKELNKERKITMLLTTHDMQDIDILTDRIIFIGKGKILYDGSREKLDNLYQEKKVIIKCCGSNLIDLYGVEIVRENCEDNEFIIIIDTRIIDPQTVIRKLLRHAVILDITIKKLSTEEIVLKMYKEFHV